MRTGTPVEAVRPGQYLKALLGWDAGDSGYTLPGDAGKRHTKLSVDMILDLAAEQLPPTVPLTAVLARVPRSDRPGGARSAAQAAGRPPVAWGDRVEQHNITLPSRLWRRIEHVGQGNRSAGVRVLAEQALAPQTLTAEDTVQLPYEVRRALRAMPGGTAAAADVNGQAAIIIKMDQADADSAHRPGVPVMFQSELGLYPQAAVIRLVCEFRDKPDNPLRMDTFLDPGKTSDYALLRKLAGQDTLDFHIYDAERVGYQYTKRIPFREVARRDLDALLDQALAHLETIPPAARNWQQARDQMMAERPA